MKKGIAVARDPFYVFFCYRQVMIEPAARGSPARRC